MIIEIDKDEIRQAILKDVNEKFKTSFFEIQDVRLKEHYGQITAIIEPTMPEEVEDD